MCYRKTPTLTVLDNHQNAIREIAWCCMPDTPDEADIRITRYSFDERGTGQKSADPRLYLANDSNEYRMKDLIGTLILQHNVDSGLTVAINDAASRPVVSISGITINNENEKVFGQATVRQNHYEEVGSSGRLCCIVEGADAGPYATVERLIWAENDDAHKGFNLNGQCISHYDPAGLLQTSSIALCGVPLVVSRRVLKETGESGFQLDWEGTSAEKWDAALETESRVTQMTANSHGLSLTVIDAAGNTQRMKYDVVQQLKQSWLTLLNSEEQIILNNLMYSASGKPLQEVHGNGVAITYTWEDETLNLKEMKTERPAGHSAGAKVLQYLRYEYDPVGNVLKIGNDAEETRFWRNQKVAADSVYTYDSLYQLLSASGREMADIGQQSEKMPSSSSFDDTTLTGYTRYYTYDAGGNLTRIRHSAPATENNYTTTMTVSDRSNRAVLNSLAQMPEDVDALFTPQGQQRVMQSGQILHWGLSGGLQKVVVVERESGINDEEYYRYGSDNQRVTKVTAQQVGANPQKQTVTWLPGLELRTTTIHGTVKESLQVITVGKPEQVRILHWDTGKPSGVENNALRFVYCNGFGSHTLEIDGEGKVITKEEFYPYGGTAVWSSRSSVEASYKTIRYSGKERDATGLYYYGSRYFQPFSGRWLNADPAGTVDGQNLYRMVRNNPLRYFDPDGQEPKLFNNPQDMFADFEVTVSKLLTQAAKSKAVKENPSMVGNRVISMAQIFYRDGTSKFTYSINLYEGLEIKNASNEFKQWAKDELGYLPSEHDETKSVEERRYLNHAEAIMFRNLTTATNADRNVKSISLMQKQSMCERCLVGLYAYRSTLPKNRYVTMNLDAAHLPGEVVSRGLKNERFGGYKYNNIDFTQKLSEFWSSIDQKMVSRYYREFERIFGMRPSGRGLGATSDLAGASTSGMSARGTAARGAPRGRARGSMRGKGASSRGASAY
ncbi:RHS repeat-associated core domain-containing protein [Enterobacter sp. CP102]|uniref:RHS repeat-associated core domain-containing protein n=1 Tax=Enterobacter sp. CP102 TaxID=2976431 RepID=UPI00220255F5|nr:RHS repeat domain-containing protein [Enterobacter sp. CP102]UWM65824.1 RHS repeat protein [Enterobacter sp. CP102]